MSGQQKVLDYSEGRGMVEGALMWAVVKPMPLSPGPGGQQQYVLSHKTFALQLPAAGSTVSFDIPEVDRNPRAGVAPDKHVFRPIQIAIVMTPDGSSLPPSWAHYENERGEKCYDGLLLRIGRVLFAPDRFTYRPPVARHALKGMTNGAALMVHSTCTLLLDPCKDGAMGIL
jgi:hypothetical protein